MLPRELRQLEEWSKVYLMDGDNSKTLLYIAIQQLVPVASIDTDFFPIDRIEYDVTVQISDLQHGV